MDYFTKQSLIIAATVLLGPAFMYALRKIRPTKFGFNLINSRMKDGRLKSLLLKDF